MYRDVDWFRRSNVFPYPVLMYNKWNASFSCFAFQSSLYFSGHLKCEILYYVRQNSKQLMLAIHFALYFLHFLLIAFVKLHAYACEWLPFAMQFWLIFFVLTLPIVTVILLPIQYIWFNHIVGPLCITIVFKLAFYLVIFLWKTSLMQCVAYFRSLSMSTKPYRCWDLALHVNV